MRRAMILTALMLSQGPCLPPGISPEFLSWPFKKVVPRSDAEAIPGDTSVFRDTVTGAKVMIVEVDGFIMIVDPTPDSEQIEFWVRVLPTSRCAWQRSRERAA